MQLEDLLVKHLMLMKEMKLMKKKIVVVVVVVELV